MLVLHFYRGYCVFRTYTNIYSFKNIKQNINMKLNMLKIINNSLLVLLFKSIKLVGNNVDKP